MVRFGTPSAKLLCLLVALIAGCSREPPTPESLGSRAATAEIAYFVFSQREIHAQTFMAVWYKACDMSKGDPGPFPKFMQMFVQAYVDRLQSEPAVAATKPLQKLVKAKWWKSGSRCETILKETPEWAREA